MQAQYMNRVQVFSENTELKYPLSDFSDGAIDKDILVDMSLSLSNGWEPPDVEVYVTNLIRTDSYLFLSIESDSEPVAHIFLTAVIPFKMYPLTMHMDGSGFIVFGPGSSRNFAYKQVRELVDPRCILPNVLTSDIQLSVNGKVYPMPDVLNIATNYYIATEAQTRNIQGYPQPVDDVLVMKRNDSKLSQEIIKFGLTKGEQGELPLLTIAGVPPDSNGNFVLEFDTEDSNETVTLTPVYSREEVPIGFILSTTGMHGCVDPYAPNGPLLGNILKSDTGEGVIWKLPLDCMFQTAGTDCTVPPASGDCPQDCCEKTFPSSPCASSET